MKMMIAVVAALMICGAGIAEAALFDTRAQIESKYGTPVESKKPMKGSDESVRYHKAPWTLQVEYIQGRAMRMAYWMAGRKLTKAEAVALINANSENGSPWADKSTKHGAAWERTDRRAKAGIGSKDGILWIATTDWLAAYAGQKKTDLQTVQKVESIRKK